MREREISCGVGVAVAILLALMSTSVFLHRICDRRCDTTKYCRKRYVWDCEDDSDVM